MQFAVSVARMARNLAIGDTYMWMQKIKGIEPMKWSENKKKQLN